MESSTGAIITSHDNLSRIRNCYLAMERVTTRICKHTITVRSDTNDQDKTVSRRSGQFLPSEGQHHMTIPIQNDRSATDVTLNHLDKIAVSISSMSDNNNTLDAESNGLNASRADIETALHEAEHILLRVRGMDCTGCEKKLYKSLASLAELSNIKTSLLLSQAEFDLIPSRSIDGNKVANIIEKMTGFSCSQIIDKGLEVELIMASVPNLSDSMLPVGVTKLEILCRNRVLVTYLPKIIGARELLSDELFRHAKLAPPSVNARVASWRDLLNHTCWKTLVSVIFTTPVLVLEWAKLPDHQVLYGALSLGFSTVIQVVVAGQFYMRALNALMFSRMIDMDLLIVISSSAAYVYSVVSYAYLAIGTPLLTGQYFETSTLLITLIMVGRSATNFARQKAMELITIESLQCPTAILVDLDSEKEFEIDARLLQYNDLFKVLPDSTVVTDGVVVSGASEVDEAIITGEATLVSKSPGKPVAAGSVNYSGPLIARVSRLPGENTINIIGTMVDEVKSSKPTIQVFADRVACYFAPAILGLAFIVFITWVIIGKAIRHQTVGAASINAMTFSISVLIVSCPCAIGLAVPLVLVIASGVAAKHGLIFKTADTIDLARNVSHVIFDKTGTLTQGTLHITVEKYLVGNSDSIRSMILGLALNSKHPVSKAVGAYLHSSGVKSSTICDVKSIPGSGIEASWNSLPVRAGNPYWLGVKDCPEVRRILNLGLTMFCVTLNDELVAVFGLQDLLRPDALETITELKKRSINIFILSGDNEAAITNIAMELGVPLSNTRGRCSPAEKQAYVKSLLQDKAIHGHTHCSGSHISHRSPTRSSTVLFIGDGSNDAPSLAMASIGLHISHDSTSPTVASSAADVILLRPSLSKVLTLIDLSTAFHRRVIFNFTWSGVYNLAAMLLAAGVIPNVRISPGFAGLGEAVSIIPVIGVAVGLRFWTAKSSVT